MATKVRRLRCQRVVKEPVIVLGTAWYEDCWEDRKDEIMESRQRRRVQRIKWRSTLSLYTFLLFMLPVIFFCVIPVGVGVAKAIRESVRR